MHVTYFCAWFYGEISDEKLNISAFVISESVRTI